MPRGVIASCCHLCAQVTSSYVISQPNITSTLVTGNFGRDNVTSDGSKCERLSREVFGPWQKCVRSVNGCFSQRAKNRECTLVPELNNGPKCI